MQRQRYYSGLPATSGFSGVGGCPPVRAAIRFVAASSAIARRVGRLALAMWGVSTTLGTASRPARTGAGSECQDAANGSRTATAAADSPITGLETPEATPTVQHGLGLPPTVLAVSNPRAGTVGPARRPS